MRHPGRRKLIDQAENRRAEEFIDRKIDQNSGQQQREKMMKIKSGIGKKAADGERPLFVGIDADHTSVQKSSQEKVADAQQENPRSELSDFAGEENFQIIEQRAKTTGQAWTHGFFDVMRFMIKFRPPGIVKAHPQLFPHAFVIGTLRESRIQGDSNGERQDEIDRVNDRDHFCVPEYQRNSLINSFHCLHCISSMISVANQQV